MSTLREMVEREMREKWLAGSYTSRGRMYVDASDAVDVALRLLGKWGHVAGCNCCDAAGDTVIRYEFDDAALPVECTEDNHVHPYRDPECAQPGGEEGKRE